MPQLDILQRASLFVTHAGTNSVHEGLYHGVPLLLAPQQLEQAMIAARVEELGESLRASGGVPRTADAMIAAAGSSTG